MVVTAVASALQSSRFVETSTSCCRPDSVARLRVQFSSSAAGGDGGSRTAPGRRMRPPLPRGTKWKVPFPQATDLRGPTAGEIGDPDPAQAVRRGHDPGHPRAVSRIAARGATDRVSPGLPLCGGLSRRGYDSFSHERNAAAMKCRTSQSSQRGLKSAAWARVRPRGLLVVRPKRGIVDGASLW